MLRKLNIFGFSLVTNLHKTYFGTAVLFYFFHLNFVCRTSNHMFYIAHCVVCVTNQSLFGWKSHCLWMKITWIVTTNRRYQFSMNGNDKCLVCNTYLCVAMVFAGFITRVTVVIFILRVLSRSRSLWYSTTVHWCERHKLTWSWSVKATIAGVTLSPASLATTSAFPSCQKEEFS